MPPIRIMIMFISFSVLTIIGISYLYYGYQIPEAETHTLSLWQYKHIGNYSYVANLKSNIIYNTTTLGPGEGPLYLRITESLDLSFKYTFQSDGKANATIEYSTLEYLQAPKWIRQLNLTIAQTTINAETTGDGTENQIEIPINDFLSIPTAETESMANQLNQEIGVYSSEFNVTITVKIQIMAETDDGAINESFTPTLGIIFKRDTADGDLLTIEGLESTKNGAITQESTIHRDWVINQRYGSYATTFIGIVGLAITTWAYRKTKPSKAEKPEEYLEDIVEPYEEIIAETTQEPSDITTTTRLTMKSMEDLVKVADSLAKPILHIEKPENVHVFVVVDETVRYELTIIAPTQEKEEKVNEGEED